MKQRGRSRRTVAGLGLCVSLVLAACGSDDDATSSTGSSGSTATSAAGTTAPTTGGTSEGITQDTDGSDATVATGDTGGSDTTAGADTTAPAGSVPEHDADAVLKVIGYSPPANVDPIKGVPACEMTHLRMIYDSLIRLDEDGRPVPGLAESWEVVDDETFQLHLRDGVTFQDGTPFNAAAIKYHIERAKSDPESTITGVLEVVDSVEAVDDLTVVLHLNQPRAGTLPTILAERAGMIPSPTAVDGDPAYGTDNAVGAGPYAFDSLVPGQLLSVRTWGGGSYWADNERWLAGLDFYPVDDTLGIQRIQSGEIDYMATKDSNLSVVEGDDSLEHILSPTNTFAQIFINYGVAPFDDVRVRQALNHALDRELLVQVLSGSGQVAWGPLSPSSWAHNPDVDDMYPYDPEKAKALLAEAGYPDGLTFTAAMIDHPYYTRLAQAVQDMLKESGITVNLETVTGAEINNAIYVRKEYAAAITAYAGSTDPSITLESKYTSYGNSNPSGQTVDGLEELLAEGARLVDQDERAAKYQAAEQLIMENALEVPIFFLGGLSVFNPKVHGIAKGYETCSIGNFINPPAYVDPS